MAAPSPSSPLKLGRGVAGALQRRLFSGTIRQMTKTVTKKMKCAWCKSRFKPPLRGRRPKYCSHSCRQRAYEARRAEQNIPSLLLGRDMDNIRSRDGIRRAVVDVLRELGMLPETSKGAKPQLRLVENPDEPEK